MRLAQAFYAGNAPDVAPLLLGAWLCHATPEGVLRRRIVETEAYFGEDDTACHAHRGRTPRTQTLYLPGGAVYVYLCYGIHELFNVVTGPAEYPQAVLIRGVEGAIGPGRASRVLGLSRELNGEDLATSPQIWIEAGEPMAYTTAPRVGINYAAPEDRERLWRFVAESTSEVK